MDAADNQVRPGTFLLAWLEEQPALPKLRQASVALFYVLDRGSRDREGLDINAKPIAARGESLMTALEEGLFKMDRGYKLYPRINLCATEDCVTNDTGSLE